MAKIELLDKQDFRFRVYIAEVTFDVRHGVFDISHTYTQMPEDISTLTNGLYYLVMSLSHDYEYMTVVGDKLLLLSVGSSQLEIVEETIIRYCGAGLSIAEALRLVAL